MNENIVDSRWKVTRAELKSFQKKYATLNKSTQDKLQEIIKYYDITNENLNKPISKNDKQRLDRQIEQCKENKIYKGYFKYRVDQLMKKTITYKALIEILFYCTYIEEENDNISTINTLYSTIALDCLNQGRKDLKKPKKSTLGKDIMLILMAAEVDGVIWEDYINALYLTNMQEIMKIYLTSIQQGIELDLYSDVMQRVFQRQRNRLIDIAEKEGEIKYSGGLDKYATAYGNIAYIEASEENQKVMFVSDMCFHVTKMCQGMDGMIFNTRDTNKFKRWWGADASSLEYLEFECEGLITGLNRPPINQHFHWCHSTLTYQLDKKVANEIRENIKSINGSDQEQYDRYKKYYGKDIPESAEQFIEWKQRNPEQWEKVKTEYYLKRKQYEIREGLVETKIREKKQDQHIIGEKGYIEGKSYFDLSKEEVYNLIETNKGKGIMIKENNAYKEIVSTNKQIGYFINENLQINKETNSFIIIYSKEGIHAYPISQGDE